jgi:hypothetical protein
MTTTTTTNDNDSKYHAPSRKKQEARSKKQERERERIVGGWIKRNVKTVTGGVRPNSLALGKGQCKLKLDDGGSWAHLHLHLHLPLCVQRSLIPVCNDTVRQSISLIPVLNMYTYSVQYVGDVFNYITVESCSSPENTHS